MESYEYLAKKFKINRQILVGLIVSIMLVACASPVELTPVTLKLNWEAGIDHLGFYAGISKRFYVEEGLDVTIVPLSSEGGFVPGQVNAGEYDFGIGGLSDLRLAQADGLPLTIFGNIYKIGPGAFFARAESGIQTPADLAGRTVVVKGEAWQELLETLLATEGMTIEDVEAVPGGFDMTPFMEGEVEVWYGYLTDEVIRARLAGLDLVTLPLYEYGIRGKAINIYTTQKTLETNPELAVKFLRASLRGWAWAIDNPSDAIDLFIELFPEKANDREFLLASFESSIPLILPSGATLGAIDCQEWNSHESLATLPSTDGLCNPDIFQAATE